MWFVVLRNRQEELEQIGSVAEGKKNWQGGGTAVGFLCD